MFSCNANAKNESVLDFVNSLTNTEKQNFIKACETDNFGTLTDVKAKHLFVDLLQQLKIIIQRQIE